jgi:Skp family chaperone for outer membrane proteins
MKNLFKTTLLVVLMSLTLASTSEAFSKTPRKTNTTQIISEAEAQKLTSRLDEIKAMDASTLTRKQKRELRHEVNAINETLHTSSGGVYVSVGALIIIILLLIILL